MKKLNFFFEDEFLIKCGGINKLAIKISELIVGKELSEAQTLLTEIMTNDEKKPRNTSAKNVISEIRTYLNSFILSLKTKPCIIPGWEDPVILEELINMADKITKKEPLTQEDLNNFFLKIKRSLSSRSLCSGRLLQSVVPPSVPQYANEQGFLTTQKKSH